MASAARLQVVVEADTKELDKGLDDADKKVSGFGSKLSSLGGSMATAFGGATLVGIGALGAGLAVGLDGANQLEAATSKLQGQLGLTGEEAAAMGEVVKNVFRNNFGESQAAVGEAVAAISQNIKGLTPEATQAATESALALESLFDAPVAESSRAVGVMMRNFQGLSETQAFDLIAAGFQRGGNFADDLLDTLTEYAPQFSALGLNAEQAMGTLIAGAEAGAFNMDKVGDAVKEFQIRAQDGSKTTREGFAAIGLSAAEMGAKIAAGGESAEQAYQATLVALAGMEDPLERNAAGVALFGTQWEDIGPTVVTAMAEGLKGVEGFEGAAKRAAETTGQGWAPAVEGLKRAFTGLLTDAMMPLLPVLTEMVKGITAAVQSEQFKAWADAIVRYVGIAINAFSSLTAIFLGDSEFIEAKEALTTFFPQSVADGIIYTVAALGDMFRAVLAGDLPEAVTQAKEVIGNFGTLISDAVEEWAAWFAGWVDSAGPDLLANLGDMLIDLIDWVQESGLALIEKLAVWAAAFIDWIGPKIPDLLREAGAFLVKLTDWLVNDGAPTLIDKLLTWGSAFVDWIGPKIPPMLLELGKLLLELGTWVVTTALPAIVLKLGEWGAAFLGWIAKDVMPTLPTKLGEILTGVGTWIVTDAAPAIVTKLVEWGAAFLGFVAKDVIPTLSSKLDAITTGISTWVGQKVSTVTETLKAIGSGVVAGIQDGVSGALSGFWTWLQNNFVDQIPTFVKNILNIRSPSGVFMDIGRNIVEGLRVGMEQRLPSIDDVISRVIGSVGGMSGAVDDWLRAAMEYTGVGADWLPGLRWIVNKESSGNPLAKNPESTASGLFQLIDTTWAGSRDKNLPNDIWNPVINAVAGIRYILDRYGSPNAAIAFWEKFNYYAEGGWAGLNGPELAVLGERGPEYVVPNHALRATLSPPMETHRIVIQEPSGRTLEEWYVQGRELAIKRRRIPAGSL